MPLSVSDLMQPAGVLEPDMFARNDPAGHTESRVTFWLNAAGSLTENEEAQAAWVYYRAFDSLATRLASQPSTITPDGVALKPYVEGQIREFRRLADYWRGIFNGLVGDGLDVPADDEMELIEMEVGMSV